jgi:hypothetical protein
VPAGMASGPGKTGLTKGWGGGGNACILGVAEDKCKMAMVGSIAEIGVHGLCIGFELVVELKKGFGVWFALELCEFRELKGSVTVIDTGGHHCLYNH